MWGGSRHPLCCFPPSPSVFLSQAIWLNLEGLSVSGPLKDMEFFVQEGGGPRILHQVIKHLVLSSLVKIPTTYEVLSLCWWEEQSLKRI